MIKSPSDYIKKKLPVFDNVDILFICVDTVWCLDKAAYKKIQHENFKSFLPSRYYQDLIIFKLVFGVRTKNF